jgi:hypothetical protein
MLAGIYPAFMLSRFNPVSTLKGGHTINPGTLRNILVVIQFAITIPLIISTIVIHRQLDYIHEANTGINREMVVTFPINDQSKVEHFPVLKKTLLSNKNVQAISGSAKLPTQIHSSSGTRRWEDAEEGQHISIYHTGVDQDFIDLLDLEIIQGRDFIEGKTKGDKEEMLINETLARQLGWDSPVGKWLHLNGHDGLIAGVMKDFNFLSFHQEMAPLALYKDPGRLTNVLVKISSNDMTETLAFLEETTMEFSPDYPFEYQFLDDAYDKMYQTEIRLGNLFNYLTGLALLIACLGIFGLAAFMASQRTKEIGIRKVLGASVAGIVILLSRDFLKLVTIGFILAVPVAWLVMNRWLEDYAFRIELQWWMFGLAGILAILIALLTVSGQSIKAALADPVNAIRNE